MAVEADAVDVDGRADPLLVGWGRMEARAEKEGAARVWLSIFAVTARVALVKEKLVALIDVEFAVEPVCG